MNWKTFWLDDTGRVRSGWRALAFLMLALALAAVIWLVLLGICFSMGLPRVNPNWLIVEALGEAAVLIAFTVIGIWALRTFEHLPASTLGLTPRGPWLQAVGAGMVIGVGLISLLVFLLWLAGFAVPAWRGFPTLIVPVLLVALAAALLFAAAEEVFFRGYIFQTLLRGIGPLGALLLLSAVFTIAHLGNPNLTPLALTNLFVTGVMFGLLYLRTGSLWLPIGLHAGWNFGQLLFNLPISGLRFSIEVPLTITFTGPYWLHGGTFGLEGGVAASALLLGVVALLTYTRRGLAFESYWWEWRDFVTVPTTPANWDFSIGARHYQWKLFVRDNPE